MVELSPIDIESILISHVGDAIIDSWTKHHLRTSHVIIHRVVEFWHPSLKINKVEEDLVHTSHLYSLVTWHEV